MRIKLYLIKKKKKSIGSVPKYMNASLIMWGEKGEVQNREKRWEMEEKVGAVRISSSHIYIFLMIPGGRKKKCQGM